MALAGGSQPAGQRDFKVEGIDQRTLARRRCGLGQPSAPKNLHRAGEGVDTDLGHDSRSWLDLRRFRGEDLSEI